MILRWLAGQCRLMKNIFDKRYRPMQPEHYIQHIDFYVDNEFISRVILTPDKLNPAAALHLKVGTGKLADIELCNLHGVWIKEVVL